MYGQHHYLVAAGVPVSVGTLLTAGWMFMAVVTVVFLMVSLRRLVRPTKGAKP
jgi:hypothetical protein